MAFNITYDDMYKAYEDCRKRKKNTSGAKQFEECALYNIVELTDEINFQQYRLKPSMCFVVEYPKAREVFCADFRDRIVQHFVYNELNPVIEKILIRDTCSCRKNKGTDYAIERVTKFLRRETDNYQSDAFIAKLDLSGFFMNIDRDKLLDDVLDLIWNHYNGQYTDVLDYLIRIIIKTDITKNAIKICNPNKWDLIPKEKSLFGNQYGIAIGNITSQMFANYYLNTIDHYLKSRHRNVVRYVDDIVIIDKSEDKLYETIENVNLLLQDYHQKLNDKKTIVKKSKYGVTFLGIDIKPYYNALSKSRINRMYYTTRLNKTTEDFYNNISSRKGMFMRYKGYNVYNRWVDSVPRYLKKGLFIDDMYTVVNLNRNNYKDVKVDYGGCNYV